MLEGIGICRNVWEDFVSYYEELVVIGRYWKVLEGIGIHRNLWEDFVSY